MQKTAARRPNASKSLKHPWLVDFQPPDAEMHDIEDEVKSSGTRTPVANTIRQLRSATREAARMAA
jgi:hypothetical protein